MSTEHPFLAITVGNTRTSVATISDGVVEELKSFDSTQTSEIVDHAIATWKSIDSESPQIVTSTSNDSVAKVISEALSDQTSRQIWNIGDDVPPAIGLHLDPETITGVDRLLNAAAAWSIINQACVVVDAGTCVTVDFVDGEGTFHGGAIAPGAQMQLDAMHHGTNALPESFLNVHSAKHLGRILRKHCSKVSIKESEVWFDSSANNMHQDTAHTRSLLQQAEMQCYSLKMMTSLNKSFQICKCRELQSQ